MYWMRACVADSRRPTDQNPTTNKKKKMKAMVGSNHINYIQQLLEYNTCLPTCTVSCGSAICFIECMADKRWFFLSFSITHSSRTLLARSFVPFRLPGIANFGYESSLCSCICHDMAWAKWRGLNACNNTYCWMHQIQCTKCWSGTSGAIAICILYCTCLHLDGSRSIACYLCVCEWAK